MRSRKQRLAARLNGSKSRGPITAEGKEKVARNAEKYGFHSKYVVLQCEDTGAWQRHLQAHFDLWKPENQLEVDLVNDIAVCRWRLNRLIAMETAAIDLALDRGREAWAKEFHKTDEITRASLAYQNLCTESPVIQNFSRQEARFRRTIEKATAQLREFQQERQEQRESEAAARPETPAATTNPVNFQNKPGNAQLQSNLPATDNPNTIHVVPRPHSPENPGNRPPASPGNAGPGPSPDQNHTRN